ncbi:hypothetical protein [Lysinibacillus xylanilyticus]|uniref:hypothetical protein n=1 Tax=Lysinibacillus xylanilyticus TaxID=582475 RepID=UPI00382F07BC
MKKLVFSVAIILSLSLASCSSSKDKNEAEQNTKDVTHKKMSDFSNDQLLAQQSIAPLTFHNIHQLLSLHYYDR